MTTAYQYTTDGYYADTVEDYGLLPSNATHTPPPPALPGHVLRWTGEAWEQVENHKGKQGYVNGQPHTVVDYGPLPEGWSDAPPPPPLDEAREIKRHEILTGFDAAMSASLTMPSASAPPTPFAVAEALYDWRTSSADEYADLLSIHAARRDELLAALEAAETSEDVLALGVSYAV